MRQGVGRHCRRRKQADKTVEHGRLMPKCDCLKRTQSALEFEGILKVEKILDRKPVDRANEGT